jgi:hypothetical protein
MALTEPFAIAKHAVSEHIQVLAVARLVTRTRDKQRLGLSRNKMDIERWDLRTGGGTAAASTSCARSKAVGSAADRGPRRVLQSGMDGRGASAIGPVRSGGQCVQGARRKAFAAGVIG